VLPVAPGIEYRLPPYDMDAVLIEIELMLDWYFPAVGMTLPEQAAAALRTSAFAAHS
jgi:N-acetylmuramate 1-kinase